MITIDINKMSNKEAELFNECLNQTPIVIDDSIIMTTLNIGNIVIRTKPTNDNIALKYARLLDSNYNKLTNKHINNMFNESAPKRKIIKRTK